MQWQKTHGGNQRTVGYSIVQTSDGGFAIAGLTDRNSPGNGDALLLKTDANGTLQWQGSYGGTQDEYCYSVVQTSDGGYALTGSTLSFGASLYDVFFVKTDDDGNQLWQKMYGGTMSDWGHSLIQTNDGGYTIAGYTYSYGAGGSDMFLVKTDINGTVQWQKTYGGTQGEAAYSVIQTHDGGYAIAGFTNSFGVGDYDVYLVKTDSAGTKIWEKVYGGEQNWGQSVVQASDGSYLVAGFDVEIGDVYLVKTDLYGEFGLTRTDTTVNAITLYRGIDDPYWNYVRIRIWRIS